MSVEVLFIGDLHFGSLNNIFPELDEPDDLIYEALQQLIVYARHNAIKHLILLGDIFDNPDPEQKQIRKFLAWLATLRDFVVHIIPGNHDYSNVGKISLELSEFVTRLFSMPNIRFYMKPTQKRINDILFCFFPWPHYKKSKYRFDGPSVNIAHIELAGMLRDNGNKIKDGISISTVEDYWVIGHLHQHQESKDGRFVFPGTLFQKNFGEKLPKGFLHSIFKLKNGILSVKHKWIAIQPPFELHNLKIEKSEDLKLVKPQVNNRPILRYKLFVKNNAVALPPNFLQNNPHIVKHEGWRTQEELETAQSGKFNLEQIPPMELEDVVFRDLSSLLKQYGLDKVQRARAKQIVRKLMEELDA